MNAEFGILAIPQSTISLNVAVEMLNPE